MIRIKVSPQEAMDIMNERDGQSDPILLPVFEFTDNTLANIQPTRHAHLMPMEEVAEELKRWHKAIDFQCSFGGKVITIDHVCTVGDIEYWISDDRIDFVDKSKSYSERAYLNLWRVEQ